MKIQKIELTANPILPCVLAVLAASPLSGQSLQVLLRTGDTLPGVPGAFVASVVDVTVADDGGWTARTILQGPNDTIEAAVYSGTAILVEGNPLTNPAGLLVESFDELLASPGGTLWGNINTDATVTMDEILYRNLVPIGREGFPVFDATQPPGTIWKDFDGFDVNDNGDLLILGDVDSPLVVGATDSALVQQHFDATGSLIEEETLLLEGDFLAGTTSQVLDVGTNTGANDVAHSNSHWIAYVRTTDDASSDEAVVFDGAIVAQEGAVGPLPGTTWDSLSSNAVDVTNAGSYTFRGTYSDVLGGLVNAIFVDGVPVHSSGDTSPSLAPFAFASFGSNPPIKLGENGNLVFFAQTDNPDATQDRGVFLGDRFLLQEGVSVIGNNTISFLNSGPNGLYASPNGRYVISRVTLDDGDGVVLLQDLGLVETMSSATVAAASLTHTDGIPVEGETLQLQMDGEQDLGVTPILLISSTPIAGWASTGAGLVTPFGELLIDVSGGNPVIIQIGLPSDFSPADFSIPIPTQSKLAGQEFYAQGFYWDIGDVSPQENFRLTNGLQITFGQ